MFTKQPRENYDDSVNVLSEIKVTEVYQPSLVDNLLYEEIDGILYQSRDVGLLFNQERLSTLGIDTVNAWLKSLNTLDKSNSLKELREMLSDDDLLKVVKSRYIQSPSELLQWSQYLNDNAADILAKADVSSEVDNGKINFSTSDVPTTSAEPK